MLINVATLVPASLKSKNVATEQYVDTSVASIDVSPTIAANNDVFAQAQGFANYTDMTNKYSTLGKTIINGGHINTGLVTTDSMIANSIQADRLAAGTNSSTVWTGGGLVSANFNGNPYGNIGNPTRGFRLSSGAAGNSDDPNIYGAYIKGSTIESSNLVTLTDNNIFTSFSITSYANVSSSTSTSFTIDVPVYGYNYTGVGYKTVKNSNNNYALVQGESVTGYSFYATKIAFINQGSKNCTVSIYAGTTLLGSYTFSGSATKEAFYTIAGTTFVYYPTTVNGLLGIVNGLLCVDNLQNYGNLKIVGSFSGGTNCNPTGFGFIHSNK